MHVFAPPPRENGDHGFTQRQRLVSNLSDARTVGSDNFAANGLAVFR
jgi:hypothetical protein